LTLTVAQLIMQKFSGFFRKSIAQRHELLYQLLCDRKNPSEVNSSASQSTSSHTSPPGPDDAVDAVDAVDATDTAAAAAAAVRQIMKPLSTAGINVDIADLMVENCIGVLGMPLGVAPTFVINGQHYVVPMCTEEPSVIAAASSTAKLVSIASIDGCFVASTTRNIMIGQVQLVDIADAKQAQQAIESEHDALIELANTFCTNMVKRGGGVIDLQVRIIEPRDTSRVVLNKPYIVVHVHVDTCAAMGANLINTIAEGISSRLAELASGRVALRILSNYCVDRRATSMFRIPVEKLAWKGATGMQVAERVLEAYYFASDDPFRAATNNKGAMNGMDAVAVATGQDWRAIEAAAHVHSSASGTYQPLAHYSIVECKLTDNDTAPVKCLQGTIDIPISVGSVGGPLKTHPTYQFSHQLLGKPDAQQLAQIIVSVGLAQNFAAMRALAIEGIQKGHMALHARNVAAAAGAPPSRANEVAAHLVKVDNITQAEAEAYLAAHPNPNSSTVVSAL
jgi:degradative hydroxymethylglutaryl-CoA reductase